MYNVYVIKYSGWYSEDSTIVISDEDYFNDKAALARRCYKEFNMEHVPVEDDVSAEWYGNHAPYDLFPCIKITKEGNMWYWATVVEFHDGPSDAVRITTHEQGSDKDFMNAVSAANVSFHQLEKEFDG